MSYSICLVTVTLTFASDFVSKIFVLGAYVLYHFGRNPKFGVRMHPGMAEYCKQFLAHFDLNLVSRIIMSVAYLF